MSEFDSVCCQEIYATNAYYSMQDTIKAMEAAVHFTWIAGHKELSNKIEEDLDVYKRRSQELADVLFKIGQRKQELIEKDNADKGRKN